MKQNMIERLFKMLGNISKKKGDNGDFYTKAVVDKKIKDAETAVRAYTDKAAADAKNDLYAEVGEKVGAVEETVKAKLDSTETNLDTKVDKVEGKGLVDKAFANDVSTRKAALGNGNIATIDSQLETYSITTRLEAEVAISGMDDSGNTVIKHKLSEKANTSDLANKVDKVNGKTLIDKTVADFLSDYGGALQVKCGIFADGAIESYSEIIARGDITAKDGHDVIAYVQKEAGGSVVVHKLSEKIGSGTTVIGSTDKIRLESADNVGPSGIEINPHFSNDVGKAFIKLGVSPTSSSKTIVGTGSITGSDMEKSFSISGNDIVCSPNSKVTHRLSQKVDKVEGKSLSTNDYNDTEKAEVAKVKNKVDKADGKSLIDANIADSLTYDSTNGIINSDANLLLANTSSVAAYNGTFRGDIKVGQLGTNKWAYTISPITGFSTSVDVTCTSGNVVHNLASKADTTNVLTRNNTQTFTPTGDYQPATKKYVDDAIAALKLDLGLD